MAILNGRAAACLTSLALSGCIGQSMPSAESITKPAMDALTQFSAWRPWQPSKAEPPQLAAAPTETKPVVESQPVVLPPVAPPRTASVQASKPRPVPARVATPRPAAAPKIIPAAATETPAPLPAALSCQTFTQPGQRVRMECNPVD